ncbi:MAG: hypothetical protein DMG53_25965, partial [Acidobacteria bacterium]
VLHESAFLAIAAVVQELLSLGRSRVAAVRTGRLGVAHERWRLLSCRCEGLHPGLFTGDGIGTANALEAQLTRAPVR